MLRHSLMSIIENMSFVMLLYLPIHFLKLFLYRFDNRIITMRVNDSDEELFVTESLHATSDSSDDVATYYISFNANSK